MNIAFLLGSLDRGGAETMLLDIARSPEKLPFNSWFIYRKDGSLSPSFQKASKKVLRLERGGFLNVISFVFQLRKFLLNQNIHIIHSHQRLDSILARISAILLKTKIIQTIHCFSPQNGPAGFSLAFLSMVMAHKNLYVSDFQRQHYCKLFGFTSLRKHSLLYNGIDFSKFNLKITTLVNPNESGKPFLMGTVGNFIPGRDPMTICRFLKILFDRKFHFRFLFIGNSHPKNPQIIQACIEFCRSNGFPEQVQFLGSRDDVPVLLPHFDALIFSTLTDTFSIALAEAIGCGVPVFVNDWPAMKEITCCGEKAIIYNSGDENDLTVKFFDFLSKQSLFQEAAIKNAAWARSTYNLETHIQGLKLIYDQLL